MHLTTEPSLQPLVSRLTWNFKTYKKKKEMKLNFMNIEF